MNKELKGILKKFHKDSTVKVCGYKDYKCQSDLDKLQQNGRIQKFERLKMLLKTFADK